MIIRFIDEKKNWENLLGNFPEKNFLQSWQWGRFHEQLGQKVFHLVFYEKGQLQGLALLVEERAKRGGYLSCAAGPLFLGNWKEGFSTFATVAAEIARARGDWFVRVRPNLPESPQNRKLFRELGFVPAPMHLHAETTWQLWLTKSSEELLRGMTKNHRYELRRAMRLGVKVVLSRDPKDVERFYRLQVLTAERQGFIPFSWEYLRRQFEAFSADNQALLFKAFWHKRLVAAALVLFYGSEAVYHYAAANQEARKTAAAYAICWQAILEAQKRGLPLFNFWGIAPEDKGGHRFAGLNHFKKGFGGGQVNYLHAHDLPVAKRYCLTFVFEHLRRFRRRL